MTQNDDYTEPEILTADSESLCPDGCGFTIEPGAEVVEYPYYGQILYVLADHPQG